MHFLELRSFGFLGIQPSPKKFSSVYIEKLQIARELYGQNEQNKQFFFYLQKLYINSGNQLETVRSLQLSWKMPGTPVV